MNEAHAHDQAAVHGAAVTLRDGTVAWLRPVLPEDRVRIEAGLTQLSLASRCFRFFVPVRGLSRDQLRYFTEVDQENHVAWIAVNPTLPHQPGLGIGRWVRLTDQPSCAELALTVVDGHQGKGLGTALLAALYVLAQARAVQVLCGVVMPENHRVTDWFARLGAALEFREGLYRVDLALREDVSRLPQNPTGQRLRSLVGQVRTRVTACS